MRCTRGTSATRGDHVSLDATKIPSTTGPNSETVKVNLKSTPRGKEVGVFFTSGLSFVNFISVKRRRFYGNVRFLFSLCRKSRLSTYTSVTYYFPDYRFRFLLSKSFWFPFITCMKILSKNKLVFKTPKVTYDFLIYRFERRVNVFLHYIMPYGVGPYQCLFYKSI